MEEVKKVEDVNILKFLKTADLGQVPDNVSDANNYLPKEVSAKIIEEIIAANIMRGYAQTLNVSGRSLSIPRILYGDAINAYKIAYGVDVTAGGREEVKFTTKSVVLEPQLVATYADMLEVDLDTADMDVSNYIRKSMALALARAEEKAMLVGEEGAGTSYLELFDGLYTIANDSGKCAQTPVTFEDDDDLTDKISDAVKSLGVYGEDRNMLVLFAANTFANNLRKSDKIQQVGTYNQSEKGVTRTGSLPLIHGVKIVESSVLETKDSGECAILARVDGGMIGQRGQILFRKKDLMETFQVRVIMAEVIDFVWALQNVDDKALGLVLLKKSAS